MSEGSFFGIEETDYGSKNRAKKAAEELPEEISRQAKWRIRAWWEKVLETARALCPIDYGILQATIRTEMDMGEAPAANFEVSKVPVQHILIQNRIVAGGMLVHPKTGRIVDYAQAVHDGHFTRSGKWIPPRPFIEMAINMHIDELYKIIDSSIDAAINTVWVGN